MSNTSAKKVPPDGGYGWVVTFAYALNNVVVLPLISSFGLVFQEAFEDTNLTATQGTLIITLNHGIGMLLSFFGGPTLRRFGYRKVAIMGAISIFVGLVLTAFSSSFGAFIISYSIINAFGIAAVMAAFSLAINSFFKEKRGRAIGVGMSITGLGAIYMPLLISLLIHLYGWRYAVLILAAICLHSLLASCLLRPAKWYLKNPVISEEMVPLNKDANSDIINSSITSSSKQNGTCVNLEEIEKTREKSASTRALASIASIEARNAVSHSDLRKPNEEPKAAYKWWESQEINLGSSINIFRESESNKNQKNEIEIVENGTKETEVSKNYIRRFVDFFDLTLLKDPIFVNILVGLSLASCVETNFSLLLPIILKDLMKYETSDIATLMSVIGFSDTLFRFISPFIGEWLKKPPRIMYMVALIMIVITRTVMLYITSFTGMLVIAFVMGVTKGGRTVYMNTIIPSYVPLERLPFASGIQMFFNGIIIITIGTLLGRIREASGSYAVPILLLNFVTLITVVIWTFEFSYFRIKKRPIQESTSA